MKWTLQAGDVGPETETKFISTWKAENLTPMIGEEKADTGIEMMVIKKTGNVLNWFSP